MILDKNTSSAFHSSPIDLYLRNMQIQTLVLTGVAADQCVLATAIDAADRGFHVVIVSDAVANLDPGSAQATQVLFGRVWGYVMTTDAIDHWLTTGEPPERTRLPV
jgi:nicotinamidase-related amidase